MLVAKKNKNSAFDTELKKPSLFGASSHKFMQSKDKKRMRCGGNTDTKNHLLGPDLNPNLGNRIRGKKPRGKHQFKSKRKYKRR